MQGQTSQKEQVEDSVRSEDRDETVLALLLGHSPWTVDELARELDVARSVGRLKRGQARWRPGVRPVGSPVKDGASLAAVCTQARTAMCEARVVVLLLGGVTCSRTALECAVAGTPLDVSDALSNLAAADVICLSEERVALSHAGRILARCAIR